MKYARYKAGMNDFKYCATLWINHPSINPTVISETLGIEPSEANQVGDKRLRNPERTYDRSWWKREWSVVDGDSVAEFLRRMVSQLSPHQEFLKQLHSEDAKIECFVGIFVDQLCDQEYPHELLGQLAELHIDLRLDQYSSKDESQ